MVFEPRVYSAVAAGNGAMVIHRHLAKSLANYRVRQYSPKLEYCPFLFPMMRDASADIVHCPADYAGLFACRDQPLIATFQNYYLDQEFSKYATLKQKLHYRSDLKMITRYSVARADKVTAASRYTAHLVRCDLGYTGAIQVIYNGVDHHRFIPVKKPPVNKKIRVGFVGNLSRRKGAQWLPTIAENLDDGIEIIIASGLRKTSLSASHAKFAFIGAIPYEAMPAFYQSLDMLLLPSYREGHSVSVIEAMSSGLPVVVGDCSSMPETVKRDVGGILCPPDSVQAYADAVNHLAAEAGLRRRMGEANRDRVENHFTLARMVREYQALFALLKEES